MIKHSPDTLLEPWQQGGHNTSPGLTTLGCAPHIHTLQSTMGRPNDARPSWNSMLYPGISANVHNGFRLRFPFLQSIASITLNFWRTKIRADFAEEATKLFLEKCRIEHADPTLIPDQHTSTELGEIFAIGDEIRVLCRFLNDDKESLFPRLGNAFTCVRRQPEVLKTSRKILVISDQKGDFIVEMRTKFDNRWRKNVYCLELWLMF